MDDYALLRSIYNDIISLNNCLGVCAMGKATKYGIIALACSTGGPQALHTLLPMLPEHLGVPMVVLQHMPSGFTHSLAERVDGMSKLTVKEATDKEVLLPDTLLRRHLRGRRSARRTLIWPGLSEHERSPAQALRFSPSARPHLNHEP